MVEVRPNFSYGSGGFGPAQYIQVNGSTLIGLSPDHNELIDAEKALVNEIQSAIYPNPNNGELLNVNLTDIEASEVVMRVVDAMGRIVYSKMYPVDGSSEHNSCF
jgi:hypothetical protein